MNLLDLALIIMLLLAALRGFQRGALSQLGGLAGAGGGLLLGAAVAPRVAGAFVNGPGAGLAVATLLTFFGFVAVGQALGLVVGGRLRSALAVVGAAPADRAAGVAVGAAGLLLSVWLLASVLGQGPIPLVSRQVSSSRIVTAVSRTLPPAPDLFSRVGAYLDRQGFPQVFSELRGGSVAPPIAPPGQGAVAAAARVGDASTVQIEADGCGGVSFGSGFVVRPEFVATNAHVVAGTERIRVRDADGTHDAELVAFDPQQDVAVLAVPGLAAAPLPWVPRPAERGVSGATLGFPGGQRRLAVDPAAVRGRGPAVGRDIYGRGSVRREVLTLSSDVRRGDSGGPFVTRGGRVAGIVFAAAAGERGTGYALSAKSVRGQIARAVARDRPVASGACRF
ncbi:MAG: MarP family serine protease [Egibacteraceae bacterium]